MENLPSIIDLLSLCWTENNTKNEFDEITKNSSKENGSKLDISLTKNEEEQDNKDLIVNEGNDLKSTPSNTEGNEKKNDLFNPHLSIERLSLDGGYNLDKKSRRKSKNNCTANRTYSLRNNSFKYSLYESPPSNDGYNLDKNSRRKSKNNSTASKTYSLRSNDFKYSLYESPPSDDGCNLGKKLKRKSKNKFTGSNTYSLRNHDFSDPNWNVSSQKVSTKKKRNQQNRRSRIWKRNCFSEPLNVPYNLRRKSRYSSFSSSLCPQEEHIILVDSESSSSEEKPKTSGKNWIDSKKIGSRKSNFRDPDWNVSSQKVSTKNKRNQQNRRSRNQKTNCFSEPLNVPYNLRRKSRYWSNLCPQEEHITLVNSELSSSEERRKEPCKNWIDSEEISSQKRNFEGKFILEPFQGVKRKRNTTKAPTKKPRLIIKKEINSQNYSTQHFDNNSLHYKEIKISRSTIKVKKMLLEVGSALNQIEAALTDWNYGTRIPTTPEASVLLNKILKINTSLKEEYDTIHESSSQMDIMETLLDFLKKSDDLAFAIQRRIKKLNKKSGGNVISDKFVPLLQKLKIQDDTTISDSRNIRPYSIIKRPNLLINGQNEYSTCSEETLQGQGLNTLGSFCPVNKAYLNEFNTKDIKGDSGANSRSPSSKARTEYLKQSNYESNDIESQQSIKLTKEELRNSEFEKITNRSRDYVVASELKVCSKNSITENALNAAGKATKQTAQKQGEKCNPLLELVPVSFSTDTSTSTLVGKPSSNIKTYRKSTVKKNSKKPIIQEVSPRGDNHFQEQSKITDKPSEESTITEVGENREDKKDALVLTNERNEMSSIVKKTVTPLKIFLGKNERSTSTKVNTSPKKIQHVSVSIDTSQYQSFDKLIEGTAPGTAQQPYSNIKHKSLVQYNSEIVLNPNLLSLIENQNNNKGNTHNTVITTNNGFFNIAGNNSFAGILVSDQNISLKLITNEYSDRKNTEVSQILLFKNINEKGGLEKNYSKPDKIVNSRLSKNNVNCPLENKENSETHNRSSTISEDLYKPLLESRENIKDQMFKTENMKVNQSTKKVKTYQKQKLKSGKLHSNALNVRQNEYVNNSHTHKNNKEAQEKKIDKEGSINDTSEKDYSHSTADDSIIKTKFKDKKSGNVSGSEFDREIHKTHNILNENVIIRCQINNESVNSKSLCNKTNFPQNSSVGVESNTKFQSTSTCISELDQQILTTSTILNENIISCSQINNENVNSKSLCSEANIPQKSSIALESNTKFQSASSTLGSELVGQMLTTHTILKENIINCGQINNENVSSKSLCSEANVPQKASTGVESNTKNQSASSTLGSELDGQILTTHTILKENIINCSQINNENVSSKSHCSEPDVPQKASIAIESNNKLQSAFSYNDILHPCLLEDNRNFSIHDNNNPSINRLLSNELASPKNSGQLCNTEEFLKNNLDIDFIDEIMTELSEEQTCSINKNNLAECQEEFLQTNYSDSEMKTNEYVHSETVKRLPESTNFENFIIQEKTHFLPSREVSNSENKASNTRDMFKVPKVPACKGNSNDTSVSKDKSSQQSLNSSITRMQFEARTPGPKNAQNESMNHIGTVVSGKGDTPESERTLSIEDIKFIRQKSEGEFLLIDDFSDLFSPNIFTW